jgi:hypothetical protein
MMFISFLNLILKYYMMNSTKLEEIQLDCAKMVIKIEVLKKSEL